MRERIEMRVIWCDLERVESEPQMLALNMMPTAASAAMTEEESVRHRLASANESRDPVGMDAPDYLRRKRA